MKETVKEQWECSVVLLLSETFVLELQSWTVMPEVLGSGLVGS